GERLQSNPALGLRAIRLSLAEPKMFQTQLRAILRASKYGKITEPMVAAIEKAIHRKFGFEVEVVVRTQKDWPKILKGNPYTAEAKNDPKFLHVLMLAAQPKTPKLDELETYCQNGEKFTLKGSELYIYYGAGAGKSKLVLGVIEKKLGTSGTARNWLTMQTLAEMLKA
ncbi:MAG: DUF1697 domain-containing protein, partial [Spirochaetes bacterium]|nr:DUF1697 domain-containing protein [Spirochaetota bacterium]